MNEPSADARDVLARYRQQRPGNGARGRNWDVVQRRIAARKRPPQSSLRRQLAWGFVAAAAAALLLLVVDRLLPRPDRAGLERDEPGSQAVHGDASEAAPPQRWQDDAEAPAPSRAEPARAPAPSPAATPAPARPTPREAKDRATARPRESSDSLALETQLVARARAALARDDLDAAEAALDEHQRRFASGALEEDRVAYATIVACRRGKADAHAQRRAFLQRYPRSPHRPRIDEACG